MTSPPRMAWQCSGLICARIWVVLVLLITTVGSFGQQTGARIRGETEANLTRKRLLEAQQLVAQGKTAEASAEYLRILEEFGDDLIQVKEEQFQSARTIVLQALRSFPPATLAGIQDRLEPAAKQLLLRGQNQRDPAPLRDLLERYGLSRQAGPARLLLAELDWERGDFASARTHWQDALKADLRPDDRAAILARMILASIFARDYQTARTELTDLAKNHPNAHGTLAGQQGRYAPILEKLMLDPPTVGREVGTSGWSGFGGSAEHRGISGDEPPTYWPSRPTWQTDIPRDGADRDQFKPAGFPAALTLAFHPVILGEFAYLADAGRVFQFHLRTGKARVAFDFRSVEGDQEFTAEELALPVTSAMAYTLSASSGKLYVRVGNTRGLSSEPGALPPVTDLLALEPLDIKNLPPKALTLRMTWRAKPPVKPGVIARWDASPVVQDGLLYACYQRLESGKTITAVAAYNEQNPDQPIWTRDLCESESDPLNRQRLDPLTLAGNLLLHATHQGLTIAINRFTGRTVWAFRNSPAELPPLAIPRSIQPPLTDGTRVYLAPADADRIFALELATGKKLWESGTFHTDHLLGVVDGKVIAAIAGPQKGIRALHAESGSDQEPFGWQNHDDPFLASHGRGFLAGGTILWPTREKLYFLRASTGMPLRQPLAGAHGNLAFAQNCLLVATARQLWCYRTTLDEPADPRQSLESLRGLGEQTLMTADPLASRRLQSFLADEQQPKSHRSAAWAELARSAKLRGAPIPSLPADLTDEWVHDPRGLPTQAGNWPNPTKAKPRSAEPNWRPRLDETDPALRVPVFSPSTELGNLTTHTRPLYALSGLRPTDDPPGLELGVPDAARCLIVCDGVSLLAYRPGAREPLWKVLLPVGLLPRWGVAVSAEVLIAAGDRGVLACRLTTGELLWEFRTPWGDPPLSAPVIADQVIIMLYGRGSLLGVKLQTGQIAWVRSARNDDQLRPTLLDTAPSFSPEFFARAGVLLVQRSDGQIWVIDSETGKVRFREAGPLNAWSRPEELNHREVVHAEGPGKLRALQLEPLQVSWESTSEGEASLTGVLPQIRVMGSSVVKLTSRNYGLELERIRPNNGRSAWLRGPRLLTDDQLSLADAASDGQNLYLISESRLQAIRWEDGRLAWEVRLPELTTSSRWQVRVSRSGLIAYPRTPQWEEGWSTLLPRLAKRALQHPTPARWLGYASTLLTNLMNSSLPVLLIERDSGKELKSLSVPVNGPASQLLLQGDVAAVVSAQGIQWLKSR